MRPIPTPIQTIALLGLSLALAAGCGKKTAQTPQTHATAAAPAVTTAKTPDTTNTTTTAQNSSNHAATPEGAQTTTGAAAPVAGPKHYLAWMGVGERLHSALLSADGSGKLKVVARGEGAALMAHGSKVWAVRPASVKKVKLKPCDTHDEVDVMGLERMPLDDPTGAARDVIYKDSLKAGDSTRYSDEVHLRAQVGDRIWVEHVLSEDTCPVSAGVIPQHTYKLVSLTSGIGARSSWVDHVVDADRLAPEAKARAVAACEREHPDAKEGGACAKKLSPAQIWPGWDAQGQPVRHLLFEGQDEAFGSMVDEVGEVSSKQVQPGGMRALKDAGAPPAEVVALWKEVRAGKGVTGQGWSALSDDAAAKLAADWLARHPAK